MEIPVVQIGPGRAYTDLYGEWTDRREIGDSGCLLIRPDFHIALRVKAVNARAAEQLEDALSSILGRTPQNGLKQLSFDTQESQL